MKCNKPFIHAAILAVTFAGLFLMVACSDDLGRNGSFDNTIECDGMSIINNVVEYELDCSNRKIFILTRKENSDVLARFFVESCTKVGDYTSAQLENTQKKLIVDDEFLIVGKEVFCNGVDDCSKACQILK
jgi:hypothetical protein